MGTRSCRSTCKCHDNTVRPSPSSLPFDIVDRYVGKYEGKDGFNIQVTREGESVFMKLGSDRVLLEPRSTRDFTFVGVDGGLEFKLDSSGMPDSCYFRTSGGETPLSRHRQ
ncbi:DUF3471 domain-containing protein [bacterium]|nr:MAG: DUF3471 domain-containing protein [bacterium]